MASKEIFDLTGKVAAVIGGTSGIGEAVTIGAVNLGATVVCLDIKHEAAANVAARAGGSADAGAIDIKDVAMVEQDGRFTPPGI